MTVRSLLRMAPYDPSRLHLLVGCLILFAVGCGAKSDRLAVSGAVRLGGAPLDEGTIRFTSLGEAKLVSTGAMIRHGAYEIPPEKGLLPGRYQVEISAPDSSAPQVISAAVEGGPGMPVAAERIPDEYNVNSDKQIEVTADGENRFDFDIPVKPKS